ncbi:unnamed protein product [Cuscuta europaea]|uniref:Retrovirus-related Pol polyprotein from transposon TNT 1-94-like beta-barrel domain-containing protein n=1 Tax=Cuscuta europaea TaxID=41803 RepID=A0A9P0ZJP2_CUSEU|nr:unnamed protein product [Cuscuta europaea]
MDELPPLTKLYQMTVQEERHRNLTRNLDERTEGIALAAHMSLPRSVREKLVCSFCRKTGHTVDNCFKKSGKYTEWWVNNPGRGRGRDRDGGNRRTDNAATHAVGIIGSMEPEDHVQRVASGSQHGPTISSEQWTTFLNMVNNFKVNDTSEKLSGMEPTVEWLLDSGASYHMTGNSKLILKKEGISRTPVTLPNGHFTYATHVGRVFISANLILNNVLFVPCLTCNLISMARLVDDLNCDISFTNKLCVIHDLPTRTFIGVGERRGGVYFF